MKFDVPSRSVESSGALMVKEIGLSANAKAYQIIFGQIYPDIIKAIVREIFANGWDSQKEAGNLDTPIDIHLPTMWEPYFSVRDYGTRKLLKHTSSAPKKLLKQPAATRLKLLRTSELRDLHFIGG